MRALLAFAFLCSSQALAGDCRPANAQIEGQIFASGLTMTIVGGGLLGTGLAIPQREGPGTYLPPIDQNVPIDYDSGAATVSDVLMYVGLGVGVAGVATELAVCGKQGASGFAWVNPILDGIGTGFLNLGATVMTKSLTGRPRPYTRSGLSLGADDYESFFSGHTSISSWGFTYGTTTILRATNLNWWQRGLIGFGVGTAGGLATGSQRIAAAKHYWTDVLVGWSVGTVVGLLPTFLEPLWAKRANRTFTLRTNATPNSIHVGVAGVW